MIMSNRGANCMLRFPGIRELNRKLCLGRLNMDSFAHKNSKLAEPIAPEGRWGGLPMPNVHAGVGMISVDAGCSWAYPRDSLRRHSVWMFQQTQYYLQLRLRSVLLESDCAQTRSWSSPGSGSAGNPGLRLLLWEKPRSGKCF